ncbi:universal stress protein [Halobacteriales archaeon Cl-PHB]
MYDTILVPTDGSEHAVRAAEHGRYLAQVFGASVHVLSVVDVQGTAGLFDAGGLDETVVEHLEAEGERAVDEIETLLGDIESVQTATVEGKPADAILEYADENGVELLAMGTHGRTGLGHYITGSVTEEVVRRSPVPVLTVRATDRSRLAGGYDEVLVPTDGSEPATAAVEPGLAIARQAGARVHTVNIVDLGTVSSHPDLAPPTQVVEELLAAGEAATDAIAEQVREAGLDAVTAVNEGFPARDLLGYADEHDIDLIAMGTAGRTGLSRYLLGSTTERVIRRADVPVLAVNARDAD